MNQTFEAQPVAECFCADCYWFDTDGYENDNQGMEDTLKSGYCIMLKRTVQQCNFCFLAITAQSVVGDDLYE